MNNVGARRRCTCRPVVIKPEAMDRVLELKEKYPTAVRLKADGGEPCGAEMVRVDIMGERRTDVFWYCPKCDRA